MDVPSVGQLPSVDAVHHGGHGGSHVKARPGAMTPSPGGGKGDSVSISQAARLAAERAAREELNASKVSRDGQRRQQPRPKFTYGAPDPLDPGSGNSGEPPPDAA